VKPPNFRYVAVRSAAEAVDILAEYDEEARVLAGGQSLVQDMNTRRVRPEVLIDINGADDLGRMRADNGTLSLGAMVRTATVEHDALVAERFPFLAEAAARVGHVAVRNRGTVGGNVAHADPAANLPGVMLALDAEFVAYSQAGERTIPARDFFVGPYRTALQPTELLAEIRLPGLPAGTGSAFLEVSRRGRGWGLAGVAAAVTLENGVISAARIGLSGVGPTALRSREAEETVTGREPSPETWATAAAAVEDSLRDPPSDIHASAGYRRHLAGVLTRRALKRAAHRAGGAR
jgi:carbon-monoxide dehydrogenase medium subunit